MGVSTQEGGPTLGDLDRLATVAHWLEVADAVRREIGSPVAVDYDTSSPVRAVHTWTNAAFNRAIMLYDEARSMVDLDKLLPAVIIARALLENVGMLALFLEELEDTLEARTEGDPVRELAVRFLNHSYSKSKEFRKSEAPGDLYLTDLARAQYGSKRPKVPQQGQMIAALDRLLKANVPDLSEDLAGVFYGPLSEWTHPSQTSITYGFTTVGAVPVPTSIGPLRHSSSLRHMIAWCLGQIGFASAIRKLILAAAEPLERDANEPQATVQ